MDTITRIVISICDAYESGFGHGLKDDQLVNPYGPATIERIAYAHGYEKGLQKRQLIKEE